MKADCDRTDAASLRNIVDSAKQTAHASRQAQETFNKQRERERERRQALSQIDAKGKQSMEEKDMALQRFERFDTDVARWKGLRDSSDKEHYINVSTTPAEAGDNRLRT